MLTFTRSMLKIRLALTRLNMPTQSSRKFLDQRLVTLLSKNSSCFWHRSSEALPLPNLTSFEKHLSRSLLTQWARREMNEKLLALSLFRAQKRLTVFRKESRKSYGKELNSSQSTDSTSLTLSPMQLVLIMLLGFTRTMKQTGLAQFLSLKTEALKIYQKQSLKLKQWDTMLVHQTLMSQALSGLGLKTRSHLFRH